MLRKSHPHRNLLRFKAFLLFFLWCILYQCLKRLVEYNAVLKDHAEFSAFTGCYLACMSYNAYLGIKFWPQVILIHDGSRLFREHTGAETIAVLQFSFQLWDFFAALCIPGLFKLEMLVHHGLTAYLSWQVFDRGLFHEPSLFFLGATEVQSVPLMMVDFFIHFPPSSWEAYGSGVVDFADAINSSAKFIFAVMFFYVRCYLWTKHTQSFVWNCQSVLSATTNKKQALHGEARQAIYIFLLALVVISALQVFWCGVIALEAVSFLRERLLI